MLKRFRSWRRQRLLRRHAIDNDLWQRVCRALPVLHRLDRGELSRLREQATLFVATKQFFGTHGLAVTDTMRVAVAAQAALPVLNLGEQYYAGWSSVVLYEGAFRTRHQHADEAGVVHTVENTQIGEAWTDGPLVLSWHDAARPAPFGEGTNVVIHECAHKLDMLSGAANGRPALHPDMDADGWARDLSAAYGVLVRELAEDRPPPFDPYAGESPAEFFAVMSEYFFALPQALQRHFPAVYGHLARFYRQDPARL